MQAVRTKYYGPTNSRGSRIKAEAQAGARWMEWDDALNHDENHQRAACAYANALGWLRDGKFYLASGALADGTEVHVLVPVQGS